MQEEEKEFKAPKRRVDRNKEFKQMMLGRQMSPTRKDAFAKGDRADQRSYADIQ